MGEKIVTVYSYTTTAEANLYRTVLEAQGIPAFVADENLIGINFLYSLALGGVRLQVLESDLEAVREILKLDANIESKPGDWGNCPKCNSQNVIRAKDLNRDQKLIWVILTFVVSMIPLFPNKQYLRCEDCGKSWSL